MMCQCAIDKYAGIVAEGMRQRATILRRPAVPELSSIGGVIDDHRPLRRSVPCEVRPPKRQRESQVAEQTQPQADADIAFPAGTDIRATDRVQVDAFTYDVIGSDPGYQDAMELVVKAVKVGQGK